MSDYTKTTNFTAKDALTTGDPEKLILGADYDTEFDALAVAIATKYDVNDLASQAEAEAEASSSKLMTPQRVAQWADYNAGIVGDLQAKIDPNADQLFGWDDSAGAAIGFTMGTGLGFNGTTVELSFLGLEDLTDPGADRIAFWDDTAGFLTWLDVTPATAGIEISGTSLVLDIDSLTNVTPVAGDEIVVADASDSGLPKAVLLSAIATLMQSSLAHDSFSGFVADEHVAHSGVTLTASTGLTGGGTIAASRSFALDISGLTAISSGLAGTDGFLVDDGGTMKRMSVNGSHLPARDVSSSGNFASTDVGTIVYWTGTTGTLTMPTSIGQDDCFIVVVNSGSGAITIAGSGVTITSANSLVSIPAGGIATLIRETSTVWFLGGSLQ